MSHDRHIKFIDAQLMENLLKSERLFVPSEFTLFYAIMSWCFTQLNPRVEELPPGGAILSYFSSLQRESSLLERTEGHQFIPLFDTVRYQGITNREFDNYLIQRFKKGNLKKPIKRGLNEEL